MTSRVQDTMATLALELNDKKWVLYISRLYQLFYNLGGVRTKQFKKTSWGALACTFSKLRRTMYKLAAI